MHKHVKCQENISIIIDCAWDDVHSETAVKSLAQQIMFCYGINKRHAHPAALYITGLGPNLRGHLTKMLFDNWQGVSVSSDEYIVNTAEFCAAPSSGDTPKQLVYLTSDAEETLQVLDRSCVYVIGGIVDRNRLKGATYAKAVAQGVRTAKLPIKENFALSATHVLTVNHVYEILLNFVESNNWADAIQKVLPKRKGPVSQSTSSRPAAEQPPVDQGSGDEKAAELSKEEKQAPDKAPELITES